MPGTIAGHDGSDRKAGPAAAGGGGVGIGDLERGADQVVDEIDLGAFHVAQRDRVVSTMAPSRAIIPAASDRLMQPVGEFIKFAHPKDVI